MPIIHHEREDNAHRFYSLQWRLPNKYIFGIGKDRGAKSKQETVSAINIHSHSFSRLTWYTWYVLDLYQILG